MTLDYAKSLTSSYSVRSSFLTTMPYTYLSPDGYLRANSRYSDPMPVDTAGVWIFLDTISSAGGLLLGVACLRSLCYGHSRPILRWRIVMVTILCITGGLPLISLITSGIISMYVSGHYSRLGQEVKADNLNSNSDKPENPFTIRLFWTLYHLFYIACDLLQTLVFTIAILHSARYSPRDQRVFNSVARVEYTSVGILALGGLLYSCLGPYDQEPSVEKAVLNSISMVSLVLTSILLTASISLQIKSNSEREGSKVRTICFERCISSGCEEISDSLCSTRH